MDGIKLPKTKKNTGSENIQSGNRDGNGHRKMSHTINGKDETTYDGKKGTTKLRKKYEWLEERKLQILGYFGNERTIRKKVSQESEKSNYIAEP